MPLVRTNDSCSSYRYTGLNKRSLPKLFGADGPLLWDMQFVRFLKQFPAVWHYFCEVQWREEPGEIFLSKHESKKVGFDDDLKPVLEVRDLLAQSVPWSQDSEELRQSLADEHARFCAAWEDVRNLARTKRREWDPIYLHFALNFSLPQLSEKGCFLRYTNGDGSFRLFVVWGVNYTD